MYMVESTKMFVAERRRKHERRASAGCSHCVGSCVCVCAKFTVVSTDRQT